MWIAGCAFAPQPLAPEDQRLLLLNDRIRASREVEPLGSSLSLSEAVARGLKYNLDHRSKMLEQTIALGTYELSNYDMLPKVLATAGYNYRNNWFITNATGADTTAYDDFFGKLKGAQTLKLHIVGSHGDDLFEMTKNLSIQEAKKGSSLIKQELENHN